MISIFMSTGIIAGDYRKDQLINILANLLPRGYLKRLVGISYQKNIEILQSLWSKLNIKANINICDSGRNGKK